MNNFYFGLDEFLLNSLREDIGTGDVTTVSCVPENAFSTASLIAKEAGIVCGLGVFERVFHLFDSTVVVKSSVTDGAFINIKDTFAEISGPSRSILTAERTALNLLTHLSGVATLTRRWADEVAGTGARIRDTRKTLPGLRALQKYAVRCGGGQNHRMSLEDAVLIKDNHVAAAGSISAALAAVEPFITDEAARLTAEVECDTLDQVREAAAAGARLILLDNFAIADMAAAVTLVADLRPRPRLEASGGLTLGRARDVAATGVDYLSVGALTHSAPVLDIALDLMTTESPLERHAADD